MLIHANLFFLLGFCYLVGLKLSFSRLCLSKLSHERYEMEAHPSMFSERAAFASPSEPDKQGTTVRHLPSKLHPATSCHTL